MKLISEINSIHKIVQKMRTKLLALEEKIEKREDFFNNKSEKWQESEKGEEYNEKTEDFQDNFNEIEFEIEQIESCLDNLKNYTE